MIAKATGQHDKSHQLPTLRSYLEAIQNPKYGTKWKKAIDTELNM
jgi:hypothetical protein